MVLQNIVCLSISTKKKWLKGQDYTSDQRKMRGVFRKNSLKKSFGDIIGAEIAQCTFKSHFLPFEQDTYENTSYLHFRSFGWGYFSVIYLNLSSRHFVETLMHDTQRLSHFLHSAQISESSWLSLIKSNIKEA